MSPAVRTPGRALGVRSFDIGPSPWRWIATLLVVAVAATAWWCIRPTEADRIRLSAPIGIRTNAEPACTLILIDQSSSMSESDPAGLRAVAVEELGRWFSTYGMAQDRVGVGWFADASDIQAPGRPDRVAEFARRGPTQPIGGGTAIAPALRSAGTALASCPPGTRPVLVLISDGVTTEGSGSVTSALESLPAATAVHLMAMDADGGFTRSDANSYWTDPARRLATVNTVARVDAASITAPLALVVSNETGQRVTPLDV